MNTQRKILLPHQVYSRDSGSWCTH